MTFNNLDLHDLMTLVTKEEVPIGPGLSQELVCHLGGSTCTKKKELPTIVVDTAEINKTSLSGQKSDTLGVPNLLAGQDKQVALTQIDRS